MVTHNPRLTTYASRVITMLDGRVDTDTQTVKQKSKLPSKRTLGSKRKKDKAK